MIEGIRESNSFSVSFKQKELERAVQGKKPVKSLLLAADTPEYKPQSHMY